MAVKTTFLGEFEHQIDDKRRLALPAIFRKRLPKPSEGDELYLAVVPGVDPCLYIVVADQLDEITGNFQLANRGWDEKARTYVTSLGRLSNHTTLDSQGRLVLLPSQMEFAGLKNRAIVVGALDHIEVWNEARYREHLARPAKDNLDMRSLAEHAYKAQPAARREGAD